MSAARLGEIARALRRLLSCNIILPDVSVDVVGSTVELWLHDAEVVDLRCRGEERYGDAAVRLTPEEAAAVAAKLLEAAARAAGAR